MSVGDILWGWGDGGKNILFWKEGAKKLILKNKPVAFPLQ